MSYLKALLKISLVVFLLLAGGIAFYTYNYGDDIKNYLLKEINQQLLLKADVEEVEISLWRDFPNLSLILTNVKMYQDQQDLILAEELRIKFSLADLIDKNFALHELEIKKGELYLIEDDHGSFFPKVWKESISDTPQEDLTFQLHLQKVSLRQIGVHYQAKSSPTSFDLNIKSAWAKGDFGMDEFQLAWNSNISGFTIIKEGKAEANEEEFTLEAICKIAQKEQQLRIEKLNVLWKNLNIDAQGDFNYKEGLLTTIQFSTESKSLQNIYPLLNEDQIKQLDSINAKAKFKLEGKLYGELGPVFHPTLLLNFEVENSSLQDQEDKWKIKKLDFKGSFESNDLSNSSLGLIRIDTLHALLNQIDVNGRMYWSLAQNSNLHFIGTASAELKLLQKMGSKDIQFNGGQINAQAELSLPMTELKNDFIQAWKKGDNSLYINVKEGDLTLYDNKVKNLNTEFALGTNDLYAKNLDLNFNETKLLFEGKLFNLISFAQKPNEVLIVDGMVNSPSIDLEKLIATTFSSNNDSTREYIVQYYLRAKVEAMKYQELMMSNLSFILTYKEDQLKLTDLQLSALEGEAHGDIAIGFGEAETVVQTEAEFTSIDVHKLFKENNNFSQEMIMAENLYGKASGFMNLQFILDDKKELINSSLVLNGFIDVVNGRLNNYEPLYKLSKYIELEELKEIKFKRLQNQVRIANEEVYIPRFQINSSALDLEMEGTHKFNNIVDYRFTLLLDQILGKKAKKPKESEFGYVEDDGLGKTQLFLRMKGDINDPDISYDNEQLGKHLKKEAQEEKQEIKAILKEEFGLFKKDTTLKSPSNTQNDKPLFEIEWDEDPEKVEKKEAISKPEEEKKSKKKGKFGKFIDKIAKPNEDEYVSPQD